MSTHQQMANQYGNDCAQLSRKWKVEGEKWKLLLCGSCALVG
ncbi:hypothetical protein PRVXH_001220 [Proteinivorax hydrogeniformans]|uniref:Uncharacterized protein n=1 Tax=Proteinivorax hydrogeniformans TaxID=1826727 RepID=A0AAU8HWW9_9FIRM